MSKQPECPECEKLAKISEESNKIGDFLEELNRKYYICEFDESDEVYYPVRKSINDYLAEYYDIDLDKVEDERRALLKWLQEQNND
jgi:hypothetical protein